MNNKQNLWEIDNLPNRLTLFRLTLVPVVLLCTLLILYDISFFNNYRYHLRYIAAWTFVLASITDFLDGYIARKKGLVTVFGSFLDPIADKFLIVSSLIMLQALGQIPPIIVVILVMREFYITSLRLLANDQGFSIPVGNMGKWKTACQMVGIPFLMANDTPWGIPMNLLGNIAIYAASFLSLYSALEYTLNLIRKIKENKRLNSHEKTSPQS